MDIHMSPYLRFKSVFTSRHLGPNIWVLANGSKMICQPLGQLLGPGSWVQSQGSTSFLCILIFGTQFPGLGTRIADLLQTFIGYKTFVFNDP